MPRSGTLLICCQNLDFSGANQVVLNIVAGTMHEGNVVILAPKLGPFASRFVECGAAVRTGNLVDLLRDIRDVFCIICNTIMTAPYVIDMAQRSHPTIWIIHEWWDDEMIQENLAIRSIDGMTVETVKSAMRNATRIVFVCGKQQRLYSPTAPSSIIYVGVPAPSCKDGRERKSPGYECPIPRRTCNFLSLGIICPRKNQVWAVKLFKKFAGSRDDVRLLIVGARYTRQYEIGYIDDVKEAISGDPRIQLYDVTTDVDQYYSIADVLLFTSVNEVTPMVISEAMSYGIPIISTNIAGIPEMISHGVEGFLMDPGDTENAVEYMNMLHDSPQLRKDIGEAGKRRFAEFFELNIMIENYRNLILTVAPPTILVDMDGAIVDWDKGFLKSWAERCPVDRSKSYYMRECVDERFLNDVAVIENSKGFFEDLPPVPNAINAIFEMQAMSLNVFICTSPLLQSQNCVQEKMNWIQKHLGVQWLERVIMCNDKTKVKGDLLIDDKPIDLMCPNGLHTNATWKQVLFDQPYNRHIVIPRIKKWSNWKNVIFPLFGKRLSRDPYEFEYERFHQETPGQATEFIVDSFPIKKIPSSNTVGFRRQLLGACGAAGLFPESLNKEQILNRGNSNQITANYLIPREYEKAEKESIDLESAEKLLVTSQNGTDELQLFRPSYLIWERACNTSRVADTQGDEQVVSSILSLDDSENIEDGIQRISNCSNHGSDSSGSCSCSLDGSLL